MKYECHNPYLPLEEHIPDVEPRVFNGRLYIFGSHDQENGSEFCELDYVIWSAPIDDLSDWRYEGVIYRKDQDPYNPNGLPLYAPDVVQGLDGRFYLFYCIKFQNSIHVAVSDVPQGPYEFYGKVSYSDGKVMSDNQPYDPAVICEDGHIYLYFGFAPCMFPIPGYENQDLKGGSVIELEKDMITVKSYPTVVIPSLNYGKGTSFEGNEFFEGPSIRKTGDTYYLIYSSIHPHQLCYATSKKPMSGFVFRGCIVSNGDVGYKGRSESDKVMSVGNNHGGLINIKDSWYIFYHRHTSLNQFNRQGCAEKIMIEPDGSIPQVTITTSGMNPGPISGNTEYPAVYCCNLTNGKMDTLNTFEQPAVSVTIPYLESRNGERYIANIKDGTKIGYKYINLQETKRLGISYRASGNGQLEVHSVFDCVSALAKGKITITPCDSWTESFIYVDFSANEQELYFHYIGSGQMELLTVFLRHIEI